MHHTRALSALVLTEVLFKQSSLSSILPKYKDQCKTAQDAAFLQNLCFGTLRSYLFFAFIAGSLLKKQKLKSKDQDLFFLICIGLYQLIELSVPPHAILSETVEATKHLKKPWARGLINAVLRNFQRQAETLKKEAQQDREAKTKHPLWLINCIQSDWTEHYESILQENQLHPPLVLRVNLLKISRENYLTCLHENEIKAQIVPGTTAGIILEKPIEVSKIPKFSEGFCSVQDGAAQLAAELLKLEPNLRILDAAAAPGENLSYPRIGA